MLRQAVILCFLFHLGSFTCQNFISSKSSICAEIFRSLEKQIVDSDANLYNLRKVFYPTSHTEPTLVNVSYNLRVSSVKNRSCDGDQETEHNRRYDYLLRTGDNRLQLLQIHAWTSKIFYTLFHPAMVNRLQPQFVQTILATLDDVYMMDPVQNALTWTTVGPILTVELYIDVQLPCWPTYDALSGSLDDLTSVLKVYADSEENVSSWGAEERAYALSRGVLAENWWRYIENIYTSSSSLPEVNFILSIILTLMISFGIYYALVNVAPANSDQKNFLFSYTFVWCGVALLLFLNFLLFFSEVQAIGTWCEYEQSCLDPAGHNKIVWLVWMSVYMIIAFIVMLVRFIRGKIQHRELFTPEWRAFVVAVPLVSTIILLVAFIYKFVIRPTLKVRIVRNLWNHLKETMRWFVNTRYPRPVKTGLEKVVKFTSIYILYMTVFISVSIFSYSLVPVLLQSFLFPFRTIAAYSFFFAAFAVYSLATFVSTFLWKEQPPTTGKLILYLSSTTIAIIFILIIAVPFVSLYQLLVSGSFTDNPLILFGVSVLPSLLLSSPLVWLFKTKFLPRFLEVDEEEEEDNNDSDVDKKKKKEKAVNETELDDVEMNRL